MSGPGWGNPVVGGTTLRIPAIQSPNFSLANQTGWAIFADGSAYFFNVTVSGTITGGTLVIDGPAGGVFVYSGTPALGNLIGSWAGAAGTDALGNTYPQGLSVTMGQISGSVFLGADFIINNSGIFIYMGAPANGNLLISLAGAGGTDGFSNAYFQGLTVYGPSGARIQLEDNGAQAALTLTPAGVTSNNIPPQVIAGSVNTGAVNEISELAVLSGKENSNADAGLQLQSAPADASALALAFIEFGGAAESYFAPGFGIRPRQPGTLGTIEFWHTMTLLNSWTVGSGGFAQYKLMPDNTVLIRLNNLVPGTIADGTTIWTAPTGYIPSSHQKLPLIVQYSVAPAYGGMPFLYTNGSALEVFDLRGTVSDIHATAVYALD